MSTIRLPSLRSIHSLVVVAFSGACGFSDVHPELSSSTELVDEEEILDPMTETSGDDVPEPVVEAPAEVAPDPGAGTLRLIPVSSVRQETEAGAQVDEAPGVRVMSPSDEPLAGIEVVFTVTSGPEGALAHQIATSDQQGYAWSQSWRLGNLVGDYTVSASAPELEGVAPVNFVAEAKSAFHIDLIFTREPTPAQFDVFDAARRRWEGVILNALPRVEGQLAHFAANCGFTVDDEPYSSDGLTIFVELAPIDGPNRTLGRAGPCLLRGADGSPAFGGMVLDTADLDVLESRGYLESVVLHEMGHVIGFGTTWGGAGLIEDPSLPDNEGADTHFTGEGAGVAFEEVLGGFEYTGGQIVPVANGAIRGSSDGHWREDVFGSELMTPILTGHESSLPLSLVTIASLQDLGFYETNLNVADPFVMPFTQASILASHAAGEPLMDGCELIQPKFMITP